MENETRNTKLQQTKYTFMVYIGVDEAAALGWKKGDKLIKMIEDGCLVLKKDERFVEKPAIAEVQGGGAEVKAAVEDVLKKLV